MEIKQHIVMKKIIKKKTIDFYHSSKNVNISFETG